MNKFIVVSFYTKKTGYEKEILRLEKSMIEHAIPYHIEAVPNLGSWLKNTHFKAIFMKNILERFFNVDIVWTDADSMFHSYPTLFDTIDCDIAMHFRQWDPRPNELLIGTMYHRNNGKIRDLINDWILFNRANKMRRAQLNFESVFNRKKKNLNVFKLPIEYCCIFDDKNRSKVRPVVEHFQASRKYRHKVQR